MDYEHNNGQGFAADKGFSDTIRFQPPTGEDLSQWEGREPTIEEILDEFLENQERQATDPQPTDAQPSGAQSTQGQPAPTQGQTPAPYTAAPAASTPEKRAQTPTASQPVTPQSATPTSQPPYGEEGEEEPTVVDQPERKRLTGWSVVWAISKYVWKIGLGLVLAGLILVIGLVGYLTVTEYNPAYAENADRGSANRSEAIVGRSLSIVTFNTGYGALGADADFFMDGGQGVLPEDQTLVEGNVKGIEGILDVSDADFIFLQEVDKDAQRSFGTNQWLQYEHSLKDYESRFALNYSCDYVPYPFTEPMGKIQSGLATYSRYDIVSATRFSLPNGFTWPNRVANLKRCLLVTRIPLEDSEQQLVLINIHMEAYDEGNVRDEQLRQLTDLMKEEYSKGNFVIAGGDFNSIFPGCDSYEIKDPELWTPGRLDHPAAGFRYMYDESNPTCRLLNQPYDPDSEATQYYVIDGFLVSPNITVDRIETLDYEFIYSDHNPVRMDFTLKISE